MAECKRCLYFDICKMYADDVRGDYEDSFLFEDCLNFKNKADFVEVCRCKDCLYFRYKVGSYGICEHWHANSQDIFDLNYCGYAEPRTPKERGGEK